MTSTSEVLAGRYRIVRLLGQGGMSDVWQAFDESRQTAVAIKIVRSGDPAFALRLVQEARALEGVEHDGLVRLLDSGTHDGQVYLVMELVEGPTLAKTLLGGPISPRRTARFGAGLADALAYVHLRGIVHRDVKPSNILLTHDDGARLADFGIARLLDASTLTIAGTTLGTAAYMAPEQLEDHQVGPSADIWSLGMVLLECLTGRRVYEGSASEVVARRLAAPVPLPSGLPVAWKLVLSGMLDHRPEQRLAGAEVAALLTTSPFKAPWVPSNAAEADHLLPTRPYDLTALAQAPTAPLTQAPTATAVASPTAILGSRVPHVGRSELPNPSWPAHRKRSALVVLGVLLIAALSTGLVLALATSPKASGHTPSSGTTLRHPDSTSRPLGTSTTDSPTTTTIPRGTVAISTLVRDIASGEAAGTVDPGIGQSISNQAEQAITDDVAGQPNQVMADLQRAATTIANGVQNGKITRKEGLTLQVDLSALATALGSSAPGPPPTHPKPGGGKGP